MKAPPAPRISEAEWVVATVLWERHPLTATQVFDQLPSGHGWKPKTVNTFLTRLVDKGVLSARKEGKAFLYAPKVSREACVRAESRSFVERVFGGLTAPLVAHLVEHGDLAEEELDELAALLKQRRKRTEQRGTR